jgi:aryl-alcohol dehydrogenase-like predicted oxidoreductase
MALPAVLQPLYNLCERGTYEREYEPIVRNHGIGVITYFSLANGFLTGKYRSLEDLGLSWRGAKVRQYLNARGFRILQALDDVSREVGAPAAQVALAWLAHQPSITAPIASVTSVAQAGDLIGAASLSLSAQQMRTLSLASEVRPEEDVSS